MRMAMTNRRYFIRPTETISMKAKVDNVCKLSRGTEAQVKKIIKLSLNPA